MTVNPNLAGHAAIKSVSELTDAESIHRFWFAELEEAKAVEASWRKDAADIVKRYRGETGDAAKKRARRAPMFNILFANHETLRPATFQHPPTPDIRRRFASVPLETGDPEQDRINQELARRRDKVADNVSTIAERALIATLDQFDFAGLIRAVVQDGDLAGRGVARIRYEAEFGKVEGVDELFDERAVAKYCFWDDFYMQPMRRWEDVEWVAFRHLMTVDQLRRPGPDGKPWASDWEEVELTADTMTSHDRHDNVLDREIGGLFKRAEVYEIWHKPAREVLFLSPGFNGVLRKDPDPLGLRAFFPCPKPLYFVSTTDTLIPVPRFQQIKSLADELDKLTLKINDLQDGLKVSGVYDKTMKEVSRLLSARNMTMIPIESIELLTAGKKLDDAIFIHDITPYAQALAHLYQAREQTKQTIFEVSGLSDIFRGATKSSETATAQQIKAQFGTLRVDEDKRQVDAFIRDLISLMAELMLEKSSKRR